MLLCLKSFLLLLLLLFCLQTQAVPRPTYTRMHRDPASFPPVFRTNILGCFLVIKALLPLIRKGTKKQVSTAFCSALLVGTAKPPSRYGGCAKQESHASAHMLYQLMIT